MRVVLKPSRSSALSRVAWMDGPPILSRVMMRTTGIGVVERSVGIKRGLFTLPSARCTAAPCRADGTDAPQEDLVRAGGDDDRGLRQRVAAAGRGFGAAPPRRALGRPEPLRLSRPRRRPPAGR